MTLLLTAGNMLFATVQPGAERLLRRGNSAYESGDTALAVGFYERAAEQGLAEAQFLLGYSYFMGEGVARNYTQAATWFKRSAAQNHLKAEYNLAYCYMNGRGVPRDYDKALDLLKQSANGGYTQAMLTLAECYEKGVLVEEDKEVANRWLRRARGEEVAIFEKSPDSHGNLPSAKSDAPPKVKILYPENESSFHTATMEIKYQLQAGGLDSETTVEVFVDGERQPATRAVRRANLLEVGLPRHDCEVRLRASNINGMSTSSINLVFDESAGKEERCLYAVVVGVGDYDDELLPDLDLACKDANDFAQVLRTKQGHPYTEVNVKQLIGDEATRSEILESMKWLKQEATPQDLCVFYFAGHGYCDEDGLFYFMSAGSTTDRFESEAVSSDDLMKISKKINSNIVIFADACFSGALLRSPWLMGQQNLVLYASSMPDNKSLEDELWGNGAFTRALIQAFSGCARTDSDDGLDTQRLDVYLTDEVKRTTKGRQIPTYYRSANIYPFKLFEYEK